MNENLKWGTSTPIPYNDKKYGLVDIVAYGTFSYQITNQELFSNNQINEFTISHMQECILIALISVLKSKSDQDVMFLSNLIDKNEILNIANNNLINSGVKIVDINILSIN